MAKLKNRYRPPAVRVTESFKKMLKGPKPQAPGAPPLPPSLDRAADNIDSGNVKRRGYQSTILGSRREASAESIATKTLLGT